MSNAVVAISNVPSTISEAELFRTCSSFGDVVLMRCIDRPPPTSSSTAMHNTNIVVAGPAAADVAGGAVAFRVEYDVEEDAAACADNMNGMLIQGRFVLAEVLRSR